VLRYLTYGSVLRHSVLCKNYTNSSVLRHSVLCRVTHTALC